MHSYILNNFPQKDIFPKIQTISKIDLEKINIQSHPDIHWIKADEKSKSKLISIDQIRELKQKLVYSPLLLNSHIVIVDNSQNLTLSAQNAFLKLLEEPNINVFIFLITDNFQSLLVTIQSRCQIINFRQKKTTENTSDIKKEIVDLNKQNISQKMLYLEKFHKDKKEVLVWLEQTINLLRESTKPENLILLKNLITTHQDINKNVNLKLSLDILAIHWNSSTIDSNILDLS